MLMTLQHCDFFQLITNMFSVICICHGTCIIDCHMIMYNKIFDNESNDMLANSVVCLQFDFCLWFWNG